MKIAIMQPYLFPYIGYFQLILSVDKFILYDDVNYIKKGWINRNNFLERDKAKIFTFSVENVSQNRLINEHYFIITEKDKIKFFNFLKQGYSNAPYYKDIMELLKNIVDFQNKRVDYFIYNSLKKILEYLKIEKEIIFSSKIEKDNSLKSQDKIIEICKILKTNEYINAIGGKELYSEEEFINNGIKLKFLKSNEVKYNQFGGEFIGNLSIIDILMFNSIEVTKNILEEYILI